DKRLQPFIYAMRTSSTRDTHRNAVGGVCINDGSHEECSAQGAWIDPGVESLETENANTVDEITMCQAAVYIEDAVHYRSVFHRASYRMIRLYSFYYSPFWQWTIGAAIAVIHLLAFIEYPSSSLSATADISSPSYNLTRQRNQVPCWVPSFLEFVCLAVFFVDAVFKSVLLQSEQDVLKQPWLVAYFVIVSLSATMSLAFVFSGCGGFFHVHRALRPFFLVQNSSMMKKTIKYLHRTVPQVLTVLILIAVYLLIFTLIAMCIVQPIDLALDRANDTDGGGAAPDEADNKTAIVGISSEFSSFPQSLFNMLVLLTTANNPDITVRSYNFNRLYSLFFMAYLFIGLFCFMNMLTAVFYNQFRGYLTGAMQTRLFRRRLGVLAAFQVLHCCGGPQQRPMCEHQDVRTVPLACVVALLNKLRLPDWRLAILRENFAGHGPLLCFDDFKRGFAALDFPRTKLVPRMKQLSWPPAKLLQRIVVHKYFSWFSIFICAANTVGIAVSMHLAFDPVATRFDRFQAEHQVMIANYAFVVFYTVEHLLLLWALGWPYFSRHREHTFYGVCTLLLLGLSAAYLVLHRANFNTEGESPALRLLMRLANIIISLRVLRIVPRLKSIKIVWDSMRDILANLRFFLGVLAVAYYVFAVIGLQLFSGLITLEALANQTACDSYAHLDYASLHFNDFAAAIVVLWDLMIVNNWHVIANAFATAAGQAARIYFVIWWLVSAIIIMNTFTALILDIYFLRLSTKTTSPNPATPAFVQFDDFAQVFREHLVEPDYHQLMLAARHIRWLAPESAASATAAEAEAIDDEVA
ncbi:hypothetical protein BOX15_Mlig010695g8, partial [Macrostomum lignano]